MEQTPTDPEKRRAPLSAERIAAEALALVDEVGLEALSFRALGRRLGCEAMSVYHYYPSKQHLLDAMVTACLAETPLPPPGRPARDRLRAFALGYREMVLRHAGFAPVLVVHRLNHREGLAWLEGIAGLIGGPEMPAARRAALFRVLSYFVAGACLDEAQGYAKGPGAADPLPADAAAAEFPAITAIGAYFGEENHLRFYEEGLEVILDWIERERARGAGPRIR